MKKFKYTKILATISNLSSSIEFIKSLYNAGMDGVRLNTAHQALEDAQKVINEVRQVSSKIPIVIDTKGPEIRTNKNKDGEPIEIREGEELKIAGKIDGESTREMVYVNYKNFVEDIPEGSMILIDDGEVGLRVIRKEDNHLLTRVENDGFIENRKSINVPGIRLQLPSLSEKDRTFINFALDKNIDFIAHSFVRDAKDVLDIKKIIDQKKHKIGIIAKIENREGVNNIDEILDLVDGIMIARGDLGIEIPFSEIPQIQKSLIEKAREKKKFVIIATQMLHSMIKKPRPTRAEVSDVANAIYDGTDCIMLSGETAYGNYPLQAVRTMSSIIEDTEKYLPSYRPINTVKKEEEVTTLDYLCETAIQAPIKLNKIKAYIMDTASGRTARELSAFRSLTPIYVECYEKYVVRNLALRFGVRSFYMEKQNNHLEFVKKCLTYLTMANLLNRADLVLTIAGNFSAKHGATYIEILEVDQVVDYH